MWCTVYVFSLAVIYFLLLVVLAKEINNTAVEDDANVVG